MLSKNEFDSLFKDYENSLMVRVEKGIVILSSKKGDMCPHLENGVCRIYKDRPIDCRLHPYQMRTSYVTPKRAKLILHTRSSCPKKMKLLISEEKAKLLVMDFGREVYGDKDIVVQRCETLLSRITNKSELFFFSIIYNKLNSKNRANPPCPMS
jgi:Fe-S-cluster containining protein